LRVNSARARSAAAERLPRGFAASFLHFVGEHADVLRWSSWILIVAGLLALAGLLPTRVWLDELSVWIQGKGVFGALAFLAVYVLLTLVCAPGSVMTLTCGSVFGFWTGLLIASSGCTIAAALAFLIARHVARRPIQSVLRRHPTFRVIDEEIERDSWRWIALVRLSPAVPFSVGHYFLGLSKARFGTYLLVSWLTMLPTNFLYVYLGSLGRKSLMELQSKSPWEWALLVASLGIGLALAVWTTRAVRAAIETAERRHPRGKRSPPPAADPGSVLALAGVALTVVVIVAFVALEPERFGG
jgi:uncharacterized membrane protein YdjX (TVP38/TMEM64 family)